MKSFSLPKFREVLMVESNYDSKKALMISQKLAGNVLSKNSTSSFSLEKKTDQSKIHISTNKLIFFILRV